VAVALAGGTVNFYSGCQLMDTITAPDTVSALLFGRFGQEDNSLVLVTISKKLVYTESRQLEMFIPVIMKCHLKGRVVNVHHATKVNGRVEMYL
jgi:hypothetical protein